jgi:D-alanyl-D-alanine carboxypeptidase/D-alanyl-D-alanine-endopeptidase (penicillin-binding protein 4)
MKIRSLLILVFLIYNNLGIGQSSLNQQLKDVFQNQAFDFASVGLSVRSLDGKEIINIDSDKKYIPASSLKLITTLLTIEELGENFKFNTRVGYSGKIDRAGTLVGNIIVIGSGDPTLGADRYGEHFSWDFVLSNIITSIEKAGIKCIDGHIEVKTNVFMGQAICPSWPYSDIANYYGGGAWGFNFNENKYDLYFSEKTTEESIATLERISPEIPNMHFISEVIIKGPRSGDNAYIYGDPFNYSKIIRGSIPYSDKPFIIKGAIPNPPLSFGFVLEHALAKKGVNCKGSKVSKDPIKKSEFKQLVSLKSPPMSKIVEEANFESVNMYCEALLKILGRKTKGEGSFESGLEYVSEALQKRGVEKHSFNINDGSGLSPRNAITPESFTKFIVVQYEKLGKKKLEKYIPHVGVSGTVKTLMQSKKGQNEFYLKSGSMGGVLSYTGIFKSNSGNMFSICFMSNNHSRGNRSVRLQAEKIFELLYQGL